MQIESFIAECRKRHVADTTIQNYTKYLHLLQVWAGDRDIDSLSDSDLLSFLDLKGMKPSVYNGYLVIVKMYLAFVRGVDVKTVLKGVKGKKITPKVLELKPEHVQWLIDACLNFRDRAMILVLAEYGFRAGELMAIRVRDVEPDIRTGGVYLTCPGGKTGSRRVLGISATAAISAWLDAHPKRGNPNAQLFCNLNGSEMHSGDVLDNVFFRLQIRARKMHPTLPHVHPHLLRHYAATNAVQRRMTESSLKLRFGWTPASNMPARYVHLSNQQSNDEYAVVNGVQKQELVMQPQFAKCPKCGLNNGPDVQYCNRCGSPMTLAAIEKLDQKDDELTQIMKKLMETLRNSDGKALQALQKILQ